MTQCILYIGFLEECSLLVLRLILGFRKTYQSITNPPRRSCDEIQIFNPIILCCAVLEYAGVRGDLYEPSISRAGPNHTRVNDLYQVRCHPMAQARLLHNLGTCIISPCERVPLPGHASTTTVRGGLQCAVNISARTAVHQS